MVLSCQADKLALNPQDHTVLVDALKKQCAPRPIERLHKVLILRGGKVIHICHRCLMSITFELWGASAPDAAPPQVDMIAFRAVPVGAREASWFEQAWGFRPVYRLIFLIDTRRSTLSMEAMVTVVAHVLAAAAGDALLLHNGELPVLRRGQGKLVLSTRSSLDADRFLRHLPPTATTDDLGGPR